MRVKSNSGHVFQTNFPDSGLKLEALSNCGYSDVETLNMSQYANVLREYRQLTSETQ